MKYQKPTFAFLLFFITLTISAQTAEIAKELGDVTKNVTPYGIGAFSFIVFLETAIIMWLIWERRGLDTKLYESHEKSYERQELLRNTIDDSKARLDKIESIFNVNMQNIKEEIIKFNAQDVDQTKTIERGLSEVSRVIEKELRNITDLIKELKK